MAAYTARRPTAGTGDTIAASISTAPRMHIGTAVYVIHPDLKPATSTKLPSAPTGSGQTSDADINTYLEACHNGFVRNTFELGGNSLDELRAAYSPATTTRLGRLKCVPISLAGKRSMTGRTT
jgi:hypothetical protein